MPIKPSGFSSFWSGCCPRCRKGKLFVNSGFRIGGFMKMNTHCSHCGVKFEPEPGFFWGAMYFSYALVVAVCISVGVALFTLVDKPELWTFSGIIIGSVLIASPGIFRLSRILMVYITAPYRHFNPKL
jgi:uncharacterized protein (DUF983 family)